MYHKQQLDYERARRQAARSTMYHVDSNDSLVQELRKSKSLGAIRRESSTDLASDGGSSNPSRSTTSTPVSELPAQQGSALYPKLKGNSGENAESSSSTSGADSPNSAGSVEEKTVAEAVPSVARS